MVDVVDEIVSIEDENIEPAAESVSSNYKKYLKGSAKVQDRSILLIDFEPILNESHK